MPNYIATEIWYVLTFRSILHTNMISQFSMIGQLSTGNVWNCPLFYRDVSGKWIGRFPYFGSTKKAAR